MKSASRDGDKKEEDVYARLGTLGVNVEAFRAMNLSNDQLEDLYSRLDQLVKAHKRRLAEQQSA